jgi:hypothetical protein
MLEKYLVTLSLRSMIDVTGVAMITHGSYATDIDFVGSK